MGFWDAVTSAGPYAKQYAPQSRQVTTPTPHHSILYRQDALPDAQATVSKQWTQTFSELTLNCIALHIICRDQSKNHKAHYSKWQLVLPMFHDSASSISTGRRYLLLPASKCQLVVFYWRWIIPSTMGPLMQSQANIYYTWEYNKQQQPFYSHHTGQPVLASIYRLELRRILLV